MIVRVIRITKWIVGSEPAMRYRWAMILCIGDVLTADELGRAQRLLQAAPFADGQETAGWHARTVKRNRQLTKGPALRDLRALVAAALERNALFDLACRPRRVQPPLVNLHEAGQEYGAHVDDAVMGRDQPVRTDVAFTLFLSDPESYEGGELVVETTGGDQEFKLPAGAMVVYPASHLHRVAPVTSGRRLAVVSWLQSLIRDPARRELLFELDTARRALFDREGKSREFDLISRSFTNLLRMWAEP